MTINFVKFQELFESINYKVPIYRGKGNHRSYQLTPNIMNNISTWFLKTYLTKYARINMIKYKQLQQECKKIGIKIGNFDTISMAVRIYKNVNHDLDRFKEPNIRKYLLNVYFKWQEEQCFNDIDLNKLNIENETKNLKLKTQK